MSEVAIICRVVKRKGYKKKINGIMRWITTYEIEPIEPRFTVTPAGRAALDAAKEPQ